MVIFEVGFSKEKGKPTFVFEVSPKPHNYISTLTHTIIRLFLSEH